MFRSLYDPSDILVIFGVKSLFTNVPIQFTLELLAPHFPPSILNLFRHCLTFGYFRYNSDFYMQEEGLAMGSPLSPILVNFFMQYTEEIAIRTANL